MSETITDVNDAASSVDGTVALSSDNEIIYSGRVIICTYNKQTLFRLSSRQFNRIYFIVKSH